MSEPGPVTWVARLTPPGQGALATLGLYGPRAWAVLRAVFRPRVGALPAEPGAGARRRACWTSARGRWTGPAAGWSGCWTGGGSRGRVRRWARWRGGGRWGGT